MTNNKNLKPMKKFTPNTTIFSPLGRCPQGRGVKQLLLLTITFFLSTFTFAQQYGWTDLSENMPLSVVLTDIQVVGEEVWISGGNDAVFYSPDGGATIQTQTLPENSGIASSIFMKSNLVGYVVTYSGNIVKTDNGGTTWTTLYEPVGTLNSVHFPPNSDTGFACGNDGKIYSFDDFSITDMTVAGLTATLLSIMFPVDNTEGKLCGDSSIRRWLNDTWNNMQIFDNTFVYNSIFFTDNMPGWVVGSQGKIFKTIDATIWNPQTNNSTSGLNDVFFINSLEGWTVGSGILLHTVNGGETWTQEIENMTSGQELTATYFTSAHSGYIVGNDIVLKYGEISGIGEQTKALQFEIYPNPAVDEFWVRSLEFGVCQATLELFDLNGRKLLEKNIPAGSKEMTVDVSSLQSGFYFCRVQTETGSATKKLIIK